MGLQGVCVCVSGSKSNDNFTSRAALHLSATTGLRVGGSKEQVCVMWVVIVSIYMEVVQGETVRPRATVINLKDIEVDHLRTNLVLRITISFRYVAKTPSIRGPFEKDVMPNELLTCGVEECEHSVDWWYGYRLEARGEENE